MSNFKLLKGCSHKEKPLILWCDINDLAFLALKLAIKKSRNRYLRSNATYHFIESNHSRNNYSLPTSSNYQTKKNSLSLFFFFNFWKHHTQYQPFEHRYPCLEVNLWRFRVDCKSNGKMSPPMALQILKAQRQKTRRSQSPTLHCWMISKRKNKTMKS